VKILQVNKFLYPKGGAEVVCLSLTEALRERGHEVRLFGMADSRNPESPDADCYPANVDYHASRGLGRKAGEALRTIYGFEARRGMEEMLRRYQPDLIHAHNIYHQLTPSILSPARRMGVPVLLTLHDYKPLCPVYTFLRDGEVCERCLGKTPWPLLSGRCKDGDPVASSILFLEALLHRVLGSYRRGVALFSSPSGFLRDKMIAGGTPAERVVFLPNALPMPRNILDRPWEPPAGTSAPNLIWVGRMSHEKGLGSLLRAVAACEAPLRLRLVGDGPEETGLRELAGRLELGEKVEWLGRRSREEIPVLLAESDGSVLPSEWYENAPLSLLESLALGRPVIASEIGGIPDMLRDGETGWLFAAGDRKALAKVLNEWATSPGERSRRGQAAYEDARRRFHPDTITDQTVEIYQRLLS